MKNKVTRGRRTHKKFIERVNSIFPERDWKVVGEYSFNKTPILIETKYGKCLMKPVAILQGTNPTVRSAIDKTDFTIARFEEAWGKGMFDYSEFKYKGTVTKSTIKCKKKGHRFEMTPNDHLNNKGCPKCGKIRASKKLFSNTKDFIKKANKIHKGKYEYSNVEYETARSLVKIVCPAHGIFEQIPNSHLSGYGCTKCGNEERASRNFFTASAGRICTLYLIECWDEYERFLKVGITSLDIQRRFKGRCDMPYNYKIIKDFKIKNSEDVQKLERYLLQICKTISYKPEKKFGGYTECVNHIAKKALIEEFEEIEEDLELRLEFATRMLGEDEVFNQRFERIVGISFNKTLTNFHKNVEKTKKNGL